MEMWTRPVRLGGGRAQLDMHVVFPVQPSAPRAVVLRASSETESSESWDPLESLPRIGVCAWWR